MLPGLWESLDKIDQVQLPNMVRLLRCAEREPAEKETNRQLFSLFSGPISASLPIAAVTALADRLPSDQHWLRADPVSLAVDWVHIYLAGNAHLKISREAATDYLKLLNHHLMSEGLVLFAPHPQRWYVQCQRQPEIKTYDPHTILGKSITDYLPTGPDCRDWAKLFTELQMLLHESVINQQRAQRHESTVDALWLWGEGALPSCAVEKLPWVTVITDHAVASGLALLNQVNCVVLQENIASAVTAHCKRPGDYLLCSQRFSDTHPDQHLNPALDQQVGELIDFLKQSVLSSLRLYPGDGYCYHLTPRQLRRWWKFW